MLRVMSFLTRYDVHAPDMYDVLLYHFSVGICCLEGFEILTRISGAFAATPFIDCSPSLLHEHGVDVASQSFLFAWIKRHGRNLYLDGFVWFWPCHYGVLWAFGWV